jgi:hypothetical protein
MNMSFVDRARRTVAVRVGWVVPLLVVVACASRDGDDLFDSTPGMVTGSPSGGRAAEAGGTPSGGSPVSAPSTGGAPAVSLPETGGSGGAGEVPSAGGDGGEPLPDPTGGATASSGGMSHTAGTAGAEAMGGTANGGSEASGGSTSGGSSGGGSGGAGAPSTGGAPTCSAEAERCDGADNDCNGEVDEGDACPDDCQGFSSDAAGHYVFCNDSVSASDADEICDDIGMRLAWVETEQENQSLLDALCQLMGVDPSDTSSNGEEQAQVRIGGSDQDDEGVWTWVSEAEAGPTFWKQESNADEPWQGAAIDGMFANWSEERPNQGGSSGEDCLVMELENGDDGAAGEWNDVGCSTRHPFVCERP